MRFESRGLRRKETGETCTLLEKRIGQMFTSTAIGLRRGRMEQSKGRSKKALREGRKHAFGITGVR